MTLDAADVPDLIGALADRFESYNIGLREARHITIEMLEAAFAELDPFEERSRIVYVPTDAQHQYWMRRR